MGKFGFWGGLVDRYGHLYKSAPPETKQKTTFWEQVVFEKYNTVQSPDTVQELEPKRTFWQGVVEQYYSDGFE